MSENNGIYGVDKKRSIDLANLVLYGEYLFPSQYQFGSAYSSAYPSLYGFMVNQKQDIRSANHK